MDTGSAYSILPFSSTAQLIGPALTAASGASIKAWGHRCVQLSAGDQSFSWKFLQADVTFPIIGADFLANFKMAVDLSGMQLLCPVGLRIPLEVPRAGSLTPAAIGVVEAPSYPSLLTVEALPSTPTLPTVEALGDRELPVLACVAAIRHFRCLVEGQAFTLYTDHKLLTYLLAKQADACSARQQ